MQGPKQAYQNNSDKMTRKRFDFIKDFIGAHKQEILEPDREFEIKMTMAIIDKVKQDLTEDKRRRLIKG